jgi:hypothetical protein
MTFSIQAVSLTSPERNRQRLIFNSNLFELIYFATTLPELYVSMCSNR